MSSHMVETKVCKRCRNKLPIDNFSLYEKLSTTGKPYVYRQTLCKVCIREYNQEQRNNTSPKRRREISILYNYGLQPEDYRRLMEEQRNGCAVCGASHNRGQKLVEEYPLVVDHDHNTGIVRGLLCDWCNRGLHAIEETEWRKKAEDYLQKYDSA